MLENNYAFIKREEVVNIAVFDAPTNELLNHFKKEFELDEIVLATDEAYIGGTYDGIKFWRPKPYPSWVKGEEHWQAPVSYPTDDKEYEWDESSTSWVEFGA